MSKAWPMVSLGEVLTRSDEWVPIDADETYREVTVRLWGKGVMLRRECLGSEIKSDRRLRVRPDQFIASRIDARNGAFGLIPAELDGAVVTNDFPVFMVDPTRLLPQYLGWMSRTHGFVEMCIAASEGTTNRVRLKEDRFLAERVPLPPLAEQRRIVARIEVLATKIAEAKAMATSADGDCDVMLDGLFRQLANSAPRLPLGEVAPLTRRPATVDPAANYPQVSVRSFGRGSFHSGVLEGSAITWEKPHLVLAGDILVSNIKAWEGAIAVAGPHDHGRYGSHRYLTFQPIEGVTTADWVCHFLLSPEGLHHVGEASPGSADRNRTTSAKAMSAIVLPLPCYEKQADFAAAKAKATALRQFHQQSVAELDALLPSILDKAFKGELMPSTERTSISVSSPEKAAPPFTDLADLVIRAYIDVRDGWSTEYLLSSPDLSQKFVQRCRKLGAERTPRELLATLINARRACALKGSEKARRFSIARDEMDLFSFASEIAFRCIQDRLQSEQQRDLTVDAMLINPELAEEFDQFASRLAPGYGPLQYRWTAITLRKERELGDSNRPMPLFDEVGRTNEVRVAKLPDSAGVYCVRVEEKPLLVAVADNLRTQIDRLLESTKTRVMPEWMEGEIEGVPRLHIMSMPKCSVSEREIVRASVLRQDFARLNFRGGPLFEQAATKR